MDVLIRLSAEHGIFLVFLVVLIEQLGIPLPAYPVLLVSGSVASHGDLAMPELLAAAVVASTLADNFWYATGRKYGHGVLGFLYRMTRPSDNFMRWAEAAFVRRGATSLLVVKFVPGLAPIATALAGTMRISRLSFVVFDTLGAVLWAGVGLAVGASFSDAVGEGLRGVERFGRIEVLVVAIALTLLALRMWWRRRTVQPAVWRDRRS